MSEKWKDRFDPREVYGKKIYQMAMEKPECVVMTADMGTPSKILGLAADCPTRCFNIGVAEQNMVGIAAGLALEGKIPWISSISPFATMRCCEQIRTDVCYNNLHVIIVSILPGISGAPLGTTHYATEDLGIFRSLANMTILQPADGWEIERAMEAALEARGPIYLRLGSGTEPHLPFERKDFKIGQAYALKEGHDASFLATGYLVHKALEAAEILEKKGLSVGVYDHHTIKPLDQQSVLEAAKHSRLVVSLEEHNMIGGLGSAVAEVLAEAGLGVPLHRRGIPDLFVGVGEREALLAKYGLDAASLVRYAEDFLNKAG